MRWHLRRREVLESSQLLPNGERRHQYRVANPSIARQTIKCEEMRWSGSTRSSAGGPKPRHHCRVKRRFCSCYSDSCAVAKSRRAASRDGGSEHYFSKPLRFQHRRLLHLFAPVCPQPRRRTVDCNEKCVGMEPRRGRFRHIRQTPSGETNFGGNLRSQCLLRLRLRILVITSRSAIVSKTCHLSVNQTRDRS